FLLKLLKKISDINYKDLTWENPLASGIISDDNLSILNEKETYNYFMKPANKMIAKLSEPIKKQCCDFIKNYKEEQINLLDQYTHNNQWKENDRKLKKITTNILDVM